MVKLEGAGLINQRQKQETGAVYELEEQPLGVMSKQMEVSERKLSGAPSLCYILDGTLSSSKFISHFTLVEDSWLFFKLSCR